MENIGWIAAGAAALLLLANKDEDDKGSGDKGGGAKPLPLRPMDAPGGTISPQGTVSVPTILEQGPGALHLAPLAPLQDKNTIQIVHGGALTRNSALIRTMNPVQTTGKKILERLICCKDTGVRDRTFAHAKDAREKGANQTDQQLGRMTIVIHDMEELRLFSDMLCAAWLMSLVDGGVGASAQNKVIHQMGMELWDFFAYHRWCLSADLALWMGSRLDKFSCLQNDKLPISTHRVYYDISDDCKVGSTDAPPHHYWAGFITHGYKAWPAYYDGIFPSHPKQKCYPDQPLYCHTQKGLTKGPMVALFELGGEFYGWYRVGGKLPDGWYRRPGDEFEAMERAFEDARQRNLYFGEIGPCGAMIELAATRFMSIAYANEINSALGLALGKQLLDTAMQGASLLIAAGVMLATSGGNWASLVAAAITAIIGAIQNIIMVQGTIEKRRQVRVSIGKKLDHLWEVGANNFGLRGRYWGKRAAGAAGFSGYAANLLIPRQDVWEDILPDDPYWHHFALSSVRPSGELGKKGAIEQLPLYYLGIDYPFVVSANPINADILALRPEADGFVDVMMNPDEMKGWVEGAYARMNILRNQNSADNPACKHIQCGSSPPPPATA